LDDSLGLNFLEPCLTWDFRECFHGFGLFFFFFSDAPLPMLLMSAPSDDLGLVFFPERSGRPFQRKTTRLMVIFFLHSTVAELRFTAQPYGTAAFSIQSCLGFQAVAFRTSFFRIQTPNVWNRPHCTQSFEELGSGDALFIERLLLSSILSSYYNRPPVPIPLWERVVRIFYVVRVSCQSVFLSVPQFVVTR